MSFSENSICNAVAVGVCRNSAFYIQTCQFYVAGLHKTALQILPDRGFSQQSDSANMTVTCMLTQSPLQCKCN